MKRIIYIPFDHQHRKFGALKDANPQEDVIALVESARMTTGRNWHKERLFFLISSARHFAQSLTEEGFTVEYVKAPTTIDGLGIVEKKYPKLRVGESACPFTTLYWDFLERHRETFSKNHRMSQQIFGINRLSDLPELKVRAQEVLKGLEAGKI